MSNQPKAKHARRKLSAFATATELAGIMARIDIEDVLHICPTWTPEQAKSSAYISRVSRSFSTMSTIGSRWDVGRADMFSSPTSHSSSGPKGEECSETWYFCQVSHREMSKSDRHRRT